MTVVHEVRLVQVDPRANANKYYICTLDAAGTLTKRWGRVGATGQTKVEPNSTRWDLERAVAAKENRGYTRVEAIDVPSAPDARPATNTAVLAAAAKASLVTAPDKTLDALIERIVAANKHAITLASGGQITFTATGQATTALGAVSAASVARARVILDEIVTAGPYDPRRPARVAEYLTLVPQKVPAKRGWDADFAADARSQAKQYDLLDALTAVVPAAATDTRTPQVQFRYKVAVADAETTKRIAAKFDADRNAMHVDVAAQKVKRVFVLTDTATGDVAARQTAVFKTRNIKTMWHGTRTHNVLNILRAGLVLAGTGTVTQESGAMFGRGIYASLESTKASRYSAGLWGVGGRERGSSYVFLADFAMGLEVRPTSASQHTLVGTKDLATGKTYASINVKPGTCGVRNHEAIVKDPARVRLQYLVELA